MTILHTVGAEATGKAFYKGRQSYVDELKEKVETSPENLVLILGPRRIGKTSVVKEYFRQGNQNENDKGIYIYIYVSKIQNLVDFYQMAIQEIKNALIENSANKKFNFFTLKRSLQTSIDAIQKRIGEVSIAGYGLKFNPLDEWERYVGLLNTLKDEFISILKEFGEKVVLGFDEVPEGVSYLINNPRGAEEIDIWLEHFRLMRHKEETKSQVKLILFGSVNMKLTLEKIGKSKVINDPYIMEIQPLNTKQAKELFWDLVDTLKLQSLLNEKDLVNQFIEGMFTHSSPWSIQNFLDKYKSCNHEKPIIENLKQSYPDSHRISEILLM